MLRFSILVLNFILITTIAHAALWVQYDVSTTRVKRTLNGDCYKRGFCGVNNSNIQEGFVEVSAEEYNLAKQPLMKFDGSIVGSSRIIDLTQAEKDAISSQQQADATSAETSNVNNLDISVKDAFTAFIKVYNNKVSAPMRITGEELKAQILEDRGL